jgi:hypothetical protein
MRRQLGPNASVAWIQAKDQPEQLAGAAFLISADLAFTCAHVIRDHLGLGSPTPPDAPRAPVKLRFEALKREVEARVEGWWPDGVADGVDDVAVLKLHEPLIGVRRAALAVASPRQQESVRAFGAAAGYQSVGQNV